MEQVLFEIGDFSASMARLELHVNVLLKSTIEINDELRQNLHQLISQHFPDTRSLLTIIQNSINAEGGISIKIEEDIAIRDAFTTHQEDEFMQEDNKYSFSDLGMKIEPEKIYRTRSKTKHKEEKSPPTCKNETHDGEQQSVPGDDENYSVEIEPEHKSDQEEYFPVHDSSKKKKSLKPNKKRGQKQRKESCSPKAKPARIRYADLTSSFLCQTCGKSYKKKYDLEKHHMLTHDIDSAPKFPCDICDKVFLVKRCLKKHKIMIHQVEPKVLCGQCGAWFKHMDILRNHVKNVHDQVRPHQCHICPKSFKMKTHLQYHLKTHERPNGGKERGSDKPVRCNFEDGDHGPH